MKRLSTYLERLIPATKTLDDILDVAKVMSGETMITKAQAAEVASLSPYLDADLMVQLSRDDHATWKAAQPEKPGRAKTTSVSPMPGAMIPARPLPRF